MEIQKVGVVGSGSVEVVLLVARARREVVVHAADADRLAHRVALIEQELGRAVAEGAVDEEAKGRVIGTLDGDDLASCDLVIEAAGGDQVAIVRAGTGTDEDRTAAVDWLRAVGGSVVETRDG